LEEIEETEEAAPAEAEQSDRTTTEIFDASSLTLSSTDSFEQQQQQREVIQFGTLNSTVNTSLMSRDPLSEYASATLRNLANIADESQNNLADTQILTTKVLATSATLSSGISVGYILWLLRGGTLLASVMASMPAWRAIDPLPILESLGGDDDNDTETLESMVEEAEDPDASPEQATDKAA